MLQTERLLLRNLRAQDAETLFNYRNDPRCNRFQRYEDTGEAYLRQFVRTFARCTFPSREAEQHYAVEHRESGEMIGDLSVFFSGEDRCYTLGLTVAPPFQHQGCGYELLSAVVARLRRAEPAMDIVALIDRDNQNSLGLFRKLGFTEECWAESIRSYVYTLYGTQS